jgi:hypothetical protein
MTKSDQAEKPIMSVFELPTSSVSTRDALALVYGGVLGVIVSAIAICVR